MARCKGTTKSGSRCKLDARPGSDYCHLHGEERPEEDGDGRSEAEAFELEDLVPLLVAGAMVAGFFVLMKTVGRWMPRF